MPLPKFAKQSTSCVITQRKCIDLDADAVIQPLGTVLCISPWNFPLAIFTGQISAALVTGNTVIAKPAEQTPLIAAQAIQDLMGSRHTSRRATASSGSR